MTFKCRATGHPSPTLSWIKNKTTINQNSKNIVLSQNNQSLTIRNAKRSDAGTYVCRATNNITSVDASANLDVHCKYKGILNFILSLRISRNSRFKDNNNIERKSPKRKFIV